MSARRSRCGAAIVLHENGDLRCSNGHSQPEATGDLVKAMAELVRVALVPLRDRIEELDARVEAVEETSSRANTGTRPVGVEEAASIAGVSVDTVYRNPERFGGWKVDPSKPKSHWRFDPEHLRALTLRDGRGGSPGRSAPTRRRDTRSNGSVDLLPVKGKAA